VIRPHDSNAPDRAVSGCLHSATGVPSAHHSTTTKGTTVSADLHDHLRRLRADERGEGVISTGIAVLIMALLGAAMWVAFSGVFNTASDNIEENVECTTSNSCSDTTGGGGGTG
jgi:hypothetical protein